MSAAGFSQVAFSIGLAAAMFVGIIVALVAGRRLGIRRRALNPEATSGGVAAVQGSIFGLVGLLIAFTFSGAASRFDARRMLIIDEVNALGTTWLRLDLLAEPAQTELRDKLRRYLDARLEIYRDVHDETAVRTAWATSIELQKQIWESAVEACRAPGMQQATMLLLPSLNQTFDIASTRAMSVQIHPPQIIFALLFALSIASALLAGYDMSGRGRPSWLHIIGFAATMALALYVILDLEYPRIGLIRVDDFDRNLIELRASMD
jgi:hypothetical protein